MPAEFEDQEAVWMGCQGNDIAFKQVRSDIVRALLPYISIRIIAQSDSALTQCRNLLEIDHINTDLIDFHIMKDNEFWMRDHGATFVINKKGQMKVINFEWSDYGYDDWLKSYYSNDNQLANNEIAKIPKTQKGLIDSLIGALLGLPIENSWIKIEGGMIEVNGNGTLILNGSLTLSRNAGATKDSISRELERVLGISNIIWLANGLVQDPHICQTIAPNYIAIGTGGHTDEFVRFANRKTILLAWVPEEEKENNPINSINYFRMNENYEILNNARDIDGSKFTIIKVPLPDLISKKVRINKNDEWENNLNIPEFMFKNEDGWKRGDTANRVASASYLNYFITNKVILMPTYINAGSSEKKEEEVISIFKSVFPERKIVVINSLPLNWRGGGIHCITNQQPKRQILP
jgi:agmatine deiminase